VDGVWQVPCSASTLTSYITVPLCGWGVAGSLFCLYAHELHHSSSVWMGCGSPQAATPHPHKKSLRRAQRWGFKTTWTWT